MAEGDILIFDWKAFYSDSFHSTISTQLFTSQKNRSGLINPAGKFPAENNGLLAGKLDFNQDLSSFYHTVK